MTTRREICIQLNGHAVRTTVETHHNLVEMLHGLGLFGARESCGQGLCGCCTVLIDGTAVTGCLYPAIAVDGKQVTTIESLDANGELSPVQQAFIECGAFQCGFCTSGFILMAEQLLAQNPDPDEDAIRHYLSGNLCRCAAYPEIIDAVKLAARLKANATGRNSAE